MNRAEISDCFGQTIEKERVKMRLSQREMANRLELSLSAYKKIITGETKNISLYTAIKAHEVTGLYTYELIGEEGYDAFRKYNSLSETSRRFIDAVIDFEAQYQTKYGHDNLITVFIPTGDLQDGMIYDTSMFEKVDVSDYKRKYGNKICYGVKITSNHLRPAYSMNDIILICTEPIRDGDTGLFLNVDEGRVYIRKFKQTQPCVLEPINGYGQTFYVNGEDERDMRKWHKIGYVLTKMRK